MNNPITTTSREKDRELQARSHGKEKKWREQLVDGLGSRFQVPLRRVIGKRQAGEKGADDGGHADFGGHHG
jgi:hypothetical protein